MFEEYNSIKRNYGSPNKPNKGIFMKLNNMIVSCLMALTSQSVLAQQALPGTLTPGTPVEPISAEFKCQVEARQKALEELAKAIGTWNQNADSAHINEMILITLMDENSFTNQLVKKYCASASK